MPESAQKYMNFPEIIAAIFVDDVNHHYHFDYLERLINLAISREMSQNVKQNLDSVQALLHPAGTELIRQVIAAQSEANPTKESQDFIKTLRFIADTLFSKESGAYNQMHLSLNRENIDQIIPMLSQITDPKLRFKLIKYLISGLEHTIAYGNLSANFSGDNTWHKLNILALNNEHASLEEYFHYLQNIGPETERRQQLLSDMAHMAQAEMEKELTSKAPDTNKIKNICSNVQKCLYDKSEFSQVLRQKFDAIKILTAPDADYMARFDMDISAGIDEVMQKNKQLTAENHKTIADTETSIKNANAEVEVAQEKQSDLKAQLEEARREIERMRTEIANLTKEKQRIKSGFDAARNNIKKLAASDANMNAIPFMPGAKKHRNPAVDILSQTTENEM